MVGVTFSLLCIAHMPRDRDVCHRGENWRTRQIGQTCQHMRSHARGLNPIARERLIQPNADFPRRHRCAGLRTRNIGGVSYPLSAIHVQQEPHRIQILTTKDPAPWFGYPQDRVFLFSPRNTPQGRTIATPSIGLICENMHAIHPVFDSGNLNRRGECLLIGD